MVAALLGCAGQHPSPAGSNSEAESPEAAAARERAQAQEAARQRQKAREGELQEEIAAANLVEMPDVVRARIRAGALGEIAQLRFQGGEIEPAIEAIQRGLEAADATGDPRLLAALHRTQYLILRYSAIEAAKRRDFDASLRTFDRLSLEPNLESDQRAQIAGDRLMILEMQGDNGNQEQERMLASALRRILGPEEHASAEPPPVSSTSPFDIDAEKIRDALSKEIGKEVSQARLPSTRDAPVADTGSMDQAALVRVVSQNKKSISACYSSALRGGTTQRGKLELRLTVEPSGAVGGVHILTEQFRTSGLGKCIADAVARWRFPAFDGAPREVELPFVLDFFQ